MNHQYSWKMKNIFLRPLGKDDAEYLRKWRNEPENSRFLRPIKYITPEAQKVWYESYLMNADEMAFAIVECEKLNRIVGSLSLYNFRGKEAEFGKFLIGDMDAHGKKIGLYALEAAVSIAFDKLKLEKIVLKVYEENIPAVTVYKKAGFKTVESKITETGKKELFMCLFRGQ